MHAVGTGDTPLAPQSKDRVAHLFCGRCPSVADHRRSRCFAIPNAGRVATCWAALSRPLACRRRRWPLRPGNPRPLADPSRSRPRRRLEIEGKSARSRIAASAWRCQVLQRWWRDVAVGRRRPARGFEPAPLTSGVPIEIHEFHFMDRQDGAVAVYEPNGHCRLCGDAGHQRLRRASCGRGPGRASWNHRSSRSA